MWNVELIRGLHNLRREHRGCIATIGNFDGVHLGHKAVLDQLAERAADYGLPGLVIIFEPQPNEFFRPETAPARLTRLREKLRALDLDGVDRVLCLRFDARFAAVSAEDFVERILVGSLGVRYLAVGDDFRFGKGRRGDFDFLTAQGARYGFQVARRHTFSIDGRRVSSTRVREALARGDLEAARALLGYDFNMFGRVAHGDKRGRLIGYPTANIYVHRLRVPLSGVFAVQVDGVGRKPLPGVANIGVRPTVDGTGRPLLEAHLFDFQGDIYGRHVRVDFLHKLRDEKRFGSLEELKQQIRIDEDNAREHFRWLTTKTP